MELVTPELNFGKLAVTDLASRRIGILVELSPDLQSSRRTRLADQLDNSLPTHQRLRSPVESDVAEHSVLDLVPLAGPGWEVMNSDSKTGPVGKLL